MNAAASFGIWVLLVIVAFGGLAIHRVLVEIRAHLEDVVRGLSNIEYHTAPQSPPEG